MAPYERRRYAATPSRHVIPLSAKLHLPKLFYAFQQNPTQHTMKLSEVTAALRGLDQIAFLLPDGTPVPAHFHVTEVGQNHKRYVDCGGTLREETVIVFQLWNANDYDHRLHPEKLADIIGIAQRKLDLSDEEVEVEYQGERNIELFGLSFDGQHFRLEATQTACLAMELCGIPAAHSASGFVNLGAATNSCTPGGGCC